MGFPYGQTVTIVSRTVSGQDEYGNDVYSETTEDVTAVVVQPSGSTENVQFTDQVSIGMVFYFPYGTDIEPTDAIQFAGDEYEVEGNPQEWPPSPFSGNVSPIEVRANKITGVSA
jgi:hypothetical protein